MKKLIFIFCLIGISACSEPSQTSSLSSPTQEVKVSDDSDMVKLQFEFPEFSAVDLKNAEASIQVKVYKRTPESEAAIADLNFIQNLPLKVAESVKNSQKLQQIELPGTKRGDERIDKLYLSLFDDHESRKNELKDFADKNGKKIEQNFESIKSELEDYYRLFSDSEEKIKNLKATKNELQQDISKKEDIQSELVSELKVELEKFSRGQTEIQFSNSTPFDSYALKTTEAGSCKASFSEVVVDAIAELQICGYFRMGNKDKSHSQKLAEILKPYFLKIVQLDDEIKGRRDLKIPKVGMNNKIEEIDKEIRNLESSIRDKMKWNFNISRSQGEGGKSVISVILERKNKELQENKDLLELYQLIKVDIDMAVGKSPKLSKQNELVIGELLSDYTRIADEKFSISASSVYDLIGENSGNTNKFTMSIPKQIDYLVIYPSLKLQKQRMDHYFYNFKIIKNVGDYVSNDSVANFEIKKEVSEGDIPKNVIHLDKNEFYLTRNNNPYKIFDLVMEQMNKSDK